MGGEENSCPTTRASIYGRCDSRGPGANMRTQSLMVTRDSSRRSVGELKLFVSSDCSLCSSAVTQPTLAAAPVCHRQLEPPGWPFWTAGQLSGLLCHGFGSLQLCEDQKWWQAWLLWCSLELWFYSLAFPGCSVQPSAPSLTELLVHSSSHRRPQTSNQEHQVPQSKYKVI